MVFRLRVMVAAVCLLAVAALASIGYIQPTKRHGTQSIAERNGIWTGRDCGQCHPQVYAEWKASGHGQAWVNPQVQAAFRHFGHDRKCQSCHAPEPILATALDGDVELREAHHETGVDCLSCHAVSDGGVAARRTIPDAPCRPRATPLLSHGSHCGICHAAIYEDWQESRFAAEGRHCHACHMLAVDDRSGGHDHSCRGGHDTSLLRSGVRMSCLRSGEELVVSVENHQTGHNFPGERHNRVLLLEVVERTKDGAIVLAQQKTIKDITPFRGESSSEQIRAGTTYVARFPIIPSSVVADIKLLYKRFPWIADRNALVVHHSHMELP